MTGSYRKTSTLEIWDMRTNELIRDVFENSENTMIHGAQWLADDSIFIGGSKKNLAGIYDRGSLAVSVKNQVSKLNKRVYLQRFYQISAKY